MNTDWAQRREYEQRLADGDGIGVGDVVDLIGDADEAEQYEALYSGLCKALADKLNLGVRDCTTDDDEETRIELVELGPAEPEENAITRG